MVAFEFALLENIKRWISVWITRPEIVLGRTENSLNSTGLNWIGMGLYRETGIEVHLLSHGKFSPFIAGERISIIISLGSIYKCRQKLKQSTAPT